MIAYKKFFAEENILLAIYLMATIIMLIAHTPWRDEGQAWLIARDRPNLFNIVTTISYEGTPALWHSCLYFLSNLLKLPYISMFLLHSAINFTAVYLFIKKTQFSFITKFLFCSSFFILYEYNIIARSYVLMLLLLVLWALFYAERFIKTKQFAVIIALLAQTTAFGFLISVVLGGNFLFELFQNNYGKKLKPILAPIIIILLALLLAYLQLRQPADSSFYFPDKEKFSLLQQFSRIIFGGFTAITPNLFCGKKVQFLSHFLYQNNGEAILGIIILLSSIALLLTKNRKIGFIYLEIILITMAFYCYASPRYDFIGALRHWGILFLVFLSSCIILKSELTETKKSSVFLEVFLAILLLTQTLRSILIIPFETVLHLSSGKAVATYLLTNNLAKEKNIAIYPAKTAAAILPYLPNKVRFYFPETETWGSYTFWSAKWKLNEHMGNLEMLKKISKDPQLSKQIEYIITNKKIVLPEPPNKIELIYSWEGNILREEHFYLYCMLPFSKARATTS